MKGRRKMQGKGGDERGFRGYVKDFINRGLEKK